MSYFAFYGRPGRWAVSTAGDSSAGIELARQLAARGITVVAAQNTDQAGERQARRLLEALPGTIRRRPQEAKDWDQLLKLRPRPPAPAGTAAPERAERGPAVQDNLFVVRIANRRVWAGEPEKTAITDRKDFVAVNDPEPEAIRYALGLAAARWGKVSVRDSAEFRRAAWRSENGNPGLTLNWDTCVERTLLEDGRWNPMNGYGFEQVLHKGFCDGPSEPLDFEVPKSEIVVLKLHGSVG